MTSSNEITISQPMVPFNFDQMQQSMGTVCQAMGLQASQLETIRRGMIAYLNPENPQVREWLVARKADVEKIVQLQQQQEQVKKELDEVSSAIDTATAKLHEIETESADVATQRREEAQTFETRRTDLSQRLNTINAELALEGKWALMTFRNPLSSSLVRSALKMGEYALHAVVPYIATTHNRSFDFNCSFGLTNPAGLMRCANTFNNEDIYIPLVAAAALAAVSHYAVETADRIMSKQSRANRFQTDLNQAQADHNTAAQNFEQREEGLRARSAENRQAVEVANKQRTELDSRREKIDGRVNGICTERLKEIVQRQISLVDKALKKGDEEFANEAGTTAMKTIVDGLVVSVNSAQKVSGLLESQPAPTLE